MLYVMGIDIGTYESKGVLVDEKGNVIAFKSLAHSLEMPRTGWAEHDAERTWWHDFSWLSHALITEGKELYALNPSRIQAVGISTIGPAVVPVDLKGRALRKAILYGIDTRTTKEIEYLNHSIGEEAIIHHGGQGLSSQSAGPKIRWIRDHEPEVYTNTYKFLSGNGYLVYKLTGNCVMDYYTACAFSPLFDLIHLKWHKKHVSFVTEMDKLPSLAWSNEVVGEVTPSAAAETGLCVGTKVIAGTADSLSEAISVGAVNQEDMMVQYGSSTFFIQSVEGQTRTESFWPSVHAVPGRYTLTGGTATAGSITRWFADQWSAQGRSMNEIYSDLNRQAENSRAGANGLILLPYFSGERTPINHQEARGVFFGLTLKHTTGDMYRALLEGIGYSIRHNIEAMKSIGFQPRQIIAVGGGTKSQCWLQCVSSICQIEQYVPRITIGASYGDAFLAAMGLGWFGRLEEVSQWVEYTRLIQPIEEDSERYTHYYHLYRKLYEQTKESMNQLANYEMEEAYET